MPGKQQKPIDPMQRLPAELIRYIVQLCLAPDGNSYMTYRYYRYDFCPQAVAIAFASATFRPFVVEFCHKQIDLVNQQCRQTGQAYENHQESRHDMKPWVGINPVFIDGSGTPCQDCTALHAERTMFWNISHTILDALYYSDRFREEVGG